MVKMKRTFLPSGAASDSILLMIVRVVTAVLGLIVTKLLSVNFSLQEYGTYSQALLVTSTATALSILGLTDATNYFYNRTPNHQEKKRYISTIFSIQYFAGILCLLIIFALRGVLSDYFANSALRLVLLTVAATPLLSNLLAMYQNLFISVGRAKTIALRNLIVSAARLGAVAAACYITEDIVTVLVLLLALDIAQVLYFSNVFAKLQFPVRVKNADLTLAKEILSFSIPMAVYVLTNALMRDIDKYVISGFSNTETLAIYTNAAKILPFDMLTASLITVLIPIITRLIQQKNYGEAKHVFKLYLRIGYLLTGIFVGGAIAVASHLMVFLYDEKYISGLPVFIVYLLIDMIRFANVTTVLSGAGKTKILMVISLLMLGVNAVLNVVSYQISGMIGPALTTLLLTILTTLALLHFGAKEIQSNIPDLFDFQEMALIGVEIAAFGAGAHWLADFLRHQAQAPLFVTLAVSYGVYLAVLLGLNYRKVLETFRQLNGCR